MNTKSRKSLIAAGLVLALGATGLGTAQAASFQHASKSRATEMVVDLGTIQVTPADAKSVPGVVDLGTIRVTPANAADARLAAREVEAPKVASLGTITVTPADSEDARYAAQLAKSRGAAYLGTILVTSADVEAAAPVIADASLHGAVIQALAALKPGKLADAGFMLKVIGHLAAGL